jgi:hypothetical protein
VIGILLSMVIVLVIVALVVRDQTEFKLSRLRGQLLALRSEEQRLGEDHIELERLVAQTGEALMRADSRLRSVTAAIAELAAVVSQLDWGVNPDQPPSAASPAIPDAPSPEPA